MTESIKEVQGPPSYENWVSMERGAAAAGANEYPLYTDADITGDVTDGYGPYEFLNTIPLPERPGEIRPSIVLRAAWHLTKDPIDLTRMMITDPGYFHGGDTTDEIAALVSLTLGIRCKAGGVTRLFGRKDARGRPCAWESGRNPIFIRNSRAPVLPRVIGPHSLEYLRPLKSFPKISSVSAIALVRAARLYQDGVWLGESEPSLSWLMIVSAVETAAVCWRTAEEPPVERLVASKPALYQLLAETKVPGLAEQVAEQIVQSLGASKKFVDFLLTFLPEPPGERPPSGMQVRWEPSRLKKALSKVYEYRSHALHAGIPFPVPMCEPPFRQKDWSAPAEAPMGGACWSMGGTWLRKETPMLLHTFEFIARGALLGWWQSLAAANATRPE